MTFHAKKSIFNQKFDFHQWKRWIDIFDRMADMLFRLPNLRFIPHKRKLDCLMIDWWWIHLSEKSMWKSYCLEYNKRPAWRLSLGGLEEFAKTLRAFALCLERTLFFIEEENLFQQHLICKKIEIALYQNMYGHYSIFINERYLLIADEALNIFLLNLSKKIFIRNDFALKSMLRLKTFIWGFHLLSNPQDTSLRLGQRWRCCLCTACPKIWTFVSCGLRRGLKLHVILL